VILRRELGLVTKQLARLVNKVDAPTSWALEGLELVFRGNRVWRRFNKMLN
jgi:hypothetical protein